MARILPATQTPAPASQPFHSRSTETAQAPGRRKRGRSCRRPAREPPVRRRGLHGRKAVMTRHPDRRRWVTGGAANRSLRAGPPRPAAAVRDCETPAPARAGAQESESPALPCASCRWTWIAKPLPVGRGAVHRSGPREGGAGGERDPALVWGGGGEPGDPLPTVRPSAREVAEQG